MHSGRHIRKAHDSDSKDKDEASEVDTSDGSGSDYDNRDFNAEVRQIKRQLTELDGAYSGWIIFTSVISLVASVVSIVVHACMIGRHLCILHLSALVYSRVAVLIVP